MAMNCTINSCSDIAKALCLAVVAGEEFSGMLDFLMNREDSDLIPVFCIEAIKFLKVCFSGAGCGRSSPADTILEIQTPKLNSVTVLGAPAQ